MIDLQKIKKLRKHGLVIAAGLLCLSLTTVMQVSAADKGAPDSGKGPGSSMRPCCDNPAASHAEKGWSPMRHHHHRMQQALKQLNLTDAQKTAIHEIRVSTKKDMIQKRADLKIAKMELGEQLRKDSVDMNVIEAQLKKVESLRTAMKLDAIKARVEIKNTLTPDQRKKLAELMQHPWQGNAQKQQKG